MRKILLLIILNYFNLYSFSNTSYVFDEIDNSSYEEYVIDFNNNMNSKSFFSYVDKIKDSEKEIQMIEYLNSVEVYENYHKLLDNISKNSNMQEKINLKLYGVKLDKITVLTNNIDKYKNNDFIIIKNSK